MLGRADGEQSNSSFQPNLFPSVAMMRGPLGQKPPSPYNFSKAGVSRVQTMTCGDAGVGASVPREGLFLRTPELPCDDREGAEKMLGSCLWASWGQGQPVGDKDSLEGTAPLPVLPLAEAERKQTREPESPAPPSARNLASSSLRLIQNHSFLFKEEQKYINKSNKEPLVLPKEGKNSPDILPLEEL